MKTCFMILLTQVPVPRELDLTLPIPAEDLKVFLVLLFLAHILFVNLMVGGSFMTVVFEIIGLTSAKFDSLARRVAYTITVNKSLAVVLGVGPLLCISLVYTTHFYSANALTGYAWLSIIPLVIIAFLLVYIHKYTWDRWIGRSKRLHITIGVAGAVVFLCVPVIFLTNINLMLFPDKWFEVKGFFSSLRVGNVFPRLFHFLTASVAVTGLFLSWWLGRKKYPLDQLLPEFTHSQLKKLFLKITYYTSLAQLVFGPLLLFTLPPEGVTGELLAVVLAGVILVIVFLVMLSREIRSDDVKIGARFAWVVLILSLVVLIMGTVRHMYREEVIRGHRVLIGDRSATFHSIEVATQMRIEAGLGAGEALTGAMTGEKVFRNCAACHAVDRVLAAPSLIEISSVYKDNPDGIVSWAKAPGRKRPEFGPMPSFAHLGEDQLRLVAEYMLEKAGEAADSAAKQTPGL